jgi:sphinganine-1-phosphate aldolase
MKLPAKGMSKADVMTALDAAGQHDLPWREGRTFAYVYVPEPEASDVIAAAYTRFLTENALDPTVYPSLLKFENEIVAMAAHHLGGDDRVVGSFTSGGTESIILAVKTARDRARALKPHITKPELLMPVTAHAAFHKACAYLDVTPVTVAVNSDDFRVRAADLEAAITPNTIQLVASAPQYAHGVIDPIADIAAVARRHDILFHVDACVGGWMLPFWRKLCAPIPHFGFEIDGVTSVSLDFHKYGYAAKGASCLLWKNADLRRYQIFATADWTGYSVVNTTVLSTKSGGPLASCWALLHYLGEEGYLRYAKRMMDATAAIARGIADMPGLRILGQPDFAMIAFAADDVSVFRLVDLMRARGWFIQPQLGFHGSEPNIHLSIGQKMTDAVGPFLADLAAAMDDARKTNAPTEQGLAAMLASVDPAQLNGETFNMLMQVAGIKADALPDGGTATINEILNAASPKLTAALLREYFNALFAQPKSG